MTDQSTPAPAPSAADQIDALIGFDAAAELAAIQVYNPERLVGAHPGATSISNLQTPFQLSMLNAGEQAYVRDQLEKLPEAQRAAAEPELVRAEMLRLAVKANVRRGHPTGTAYDQEMAALLNEDYDTQDERNDLAAALEVIERYDTEFDINGKPTPVPVYRVKGSDREDAQRKLARLDAKLANFDSRDHSHRLNKAALSEVDKRRAQAVEVYKLTEAKKRAGVDELEAQIAKLADGFRSLANKPE